MEKAAGQTTSWLNAGFVASNMRKPILHSMPTSGKRERLSKAMYIPTTLSAVIQRSTIRHPHHIIIRHCWLIMLLNGGTSLIQLQISVHYKMLEFLSWQLNHYSCQLYKKILVNKKTSAGVFDPSGQGLFIYIGIKYNILLYLIYLFYHFHFCR